MLLVHTPVNTLASFHTVRAVVCLFGKLIQLSCHSGWFNHLPNCSALNGTNSLSKIESRPTSFKKLDEVYKPVAHLQTGQVYNWFTTNTYPYNVDTLK